MISDLTFFTNEPGRNLRDRFHAMLTDHTRFFDCLVGYFYLSGFHQLCPSLEKTEKIRILIGLKTNQAVYDLIQEANGQRRLKFVSHTESKDRLPQDILDELDRSDDSAQVEDGISRFIEWVKSGKLQIKVYPSEKIHAKLYILTFVDGFFERGHVITGSSNLSQSGLQDNLEFNVELKNRADYEFSLQKFNELWADAVEVSPLYVETIQSKSPFAQFPPYQLYLKFLYEYFKAELNQPDELEDAWLPGGFKKLRYQEDAVLSASKILEEYGGVFLSDVVGLGKTYMSALLAQQLEGRTLVIAPPTLIDRNNPGSWPNVFGDFRIPQAEFESIGKLDDLLRCDITKFTNVFIDEAHRFRTETTGTYEKLAQICRGKRVILVTATPLNNSPRDILSQIKLFQNGKNSTIPNLRNLEAFFNRLEKRLKGLDRQRDREEYFRVVQASAREIRERALKYLMIRRTRSEIANYYAEDLAAQDLKFPEVADPTPCFYEFSPQEDRVFTETIELLVRKFSYARYRPLTYYTCELSENELTGQRNLARFMKVLLVKRLESSFHAFRLTLDRFIHSYERFIAAYHNGDVYISKRYTTRLFDLLENGEHETVERLLESDLAQRYDAAEFSEDFIRDLESDLKTLRKIRRAWEDIKRDPKWEELRSLLTGEGPCAQGKMILFTESKETAEYLALKMGDELNEAALIYTGGSDKAARDLVIQNFDARHHNPSDEHRVLITTEVLAEGVSLHRSSTVINYDIPWNPTRLIQRVGRVNRVDTSFDVIRTFNFFPTEQSNDLLKLKEAAEAKIQAFIEMLGADSRLLTEGEEIKSHDLFQRINSKQTITGEDEEEVSELEYLKVIREVRDREPDLFEKIKRLPRKARAARAAYEHSGNALLTYFRKGRLEKFFVSNGAAAPTRELDFLEAVKLLECGPQTEACVIGRDFYQLLDRNKEAFITATLEESAIDELPASSRDHSAKLLHRLKSKDIRHFKGFTDDDEEFIRRVVRLLEDGALPRPTTKKLMTALQNEINPLKILSVLRRDIPASFFQPTQAAQSNRNNAPREVILSAYLIGE
ncbi:MAG: helicase [Acidobacteria bacterium]|nr:helicase [Acidobacteriota bacterium]